jgi:hypothetical protein
MPWMDRTDDRPPQKWVCRRGKISRPAGFPYRPTSSEWAGGRESQNRAEDWTGGPTHHSSANRPCQPPLRHGMLRPNWSIASAIHTTPPPPPHALRGTAQEDHCTHVCPLYLAQPESIKYRINLGESEPTLILYK